MSADNTLILKLSHLQVRGLKDKGSWRDKQDPALVITVGDCKPFETARVQVQCMSMSV
jgi:hypothetical protein